MRARLVAIWMVVAGCSLGEPRGPGAASVDAARPGTPPTTRPELARCTGRAFTPEAAAGWRHTTTRLTTALGAARHDAADVLVTTAAAPSTRLAAKFTYGKIKKDLEDEWVRAYVDDCAGWSTLGAALTDDDGRATFELGDLPVGVYDLRFVVRGDASVTAATAWVLPTGTHLAVFDLDGTLTTSDAELILDVADSIFDGSYQAQTYAGAIELVAAHADRGHVPVILSGRPRWLTAATRAWLADRGAPPAPLILAPGNAEAIPSAGGVGDFKRASLEALVAMGFVIDVAYGNASTDLYAYLGAGVAADDVWIIGAHAGERGTHDPGADWLARAAAVAGSAAIAQPFTR